MNDATPGKPLSPATTIPLIKQKSWLPSPGLWNADGRRAAMLLSALFFFAFLVPSLHAQGCAQCRDNTAATPPATQRAYRHAIILMTVTAGGIFIATLALFKRRF
jgi:hypothetical protein